MAGGDRHWEGPHIGAISGDRDGSAGAAGRGGGSEQRARLWRTTVGNAVLGRAFCTRNVASVARGCEDGKD